jgi:hypothetical protein
MQTVSARQTQTQVLTNAFIPQRLQLDGHRSGAYRLCRLFCRQHRAELMRVVYLRPGGSFSSLTIGARVRPGRTRPQDEGVHGDLSLSAVRRSERGHHVDHLLWSTPLESIASTFFICAGDLYAACSIFGYVTKRDLTGLGTVHVHGTSSGSFIASIVNMFLGSHGVAMIISYIGVIVFVGSDRLRHAETEGDGPVSQPAGLDAGNRSQRRSIHRCPDPLSRFHPDVPVPAHDLRRQPGLERI